MDASWFAIDGTLEPLDYDGPTYFRFPMALAERVVAAYSAPGDWVHDPFCGFGTALVAAQRLERHAIGIEKDSGRARFAASRINPPSRVIAGDVREVAPHELLPCSLLFTSPPYTTLRAWDEEGFAAYFDDLRAIFGALAAALERGARIVVEMSNVRTEDGVRTVAWDAARVLADLFRFEGEIVRCNTGPEPAGPGYRHSYLLLFTTASSVPRWRRREPDGARRPLPGAGASGSVPVADRPDADRDRGRMSAVGGAADHGQDRQHRRPASPDPSPTPKTGVRPMQSDVDFSLYEPSQAPAIVELWNRTIGESYPLREALLRQNLDRNPNFRSVDAVTVRRGDRLVGFGLLQRYRGDAPLCRDWQRRAWLAAVVVAPELQRTGVGTRVAEWLTARAEGIAPEDVAAGGGIFWFFPGAPADLPAARPFLASLGYRFGGATYYDVRADLSTFALPGASEGVIADHGLAVRGCEPGEVDPLLDFLAAEFGAGWWHNAGQFFRAGGSPADWLLLVRGAEIVGMAQLHHAGQAVIGAPRYWRSGPEAGGFGPIGVAAALRGHGLGLALLHQTMAHLRARGVTDAVADWTGLLDFYAKAGFAPWKAYDAASGRAR